MEPYILSYIKVRKVNHSSCTSFSCMKIRKLIKV
nr:MAG TPA: hypothetical protein [Caudoviricetes sp.]